MFNVLSNHSSLKATAHVFVCGRTDCDNTVEITTVLFVRQIQEDDKHNYQQFRHVKE